MPGDSIRIGVIGCGYWGPNHIRNFLALRSTGAEIVMAADRDPQRRDHIAKLYPSVRLAESAETVIGNPDIDAVVVATPVSSHYPLTRAALQAGKHVLVEKPFVTDIKQAADLSALARYQQRILMVGHTFQYAAAVNHIRDVIDQGQLGDVLYVRSLRVNLGIFQQDVSVLWDLAPHDVSILLYVLQREPTAVSAVGTSHFSNGLADVVSLTIDFGPELMANIIASWLDPRKVREMTIVGTKKMLVYDDVSANEKVRIYDRGVDGPQHYDSFGDFQYSYRYGDIVTPYLADYEPLREECAHFLECIRTGSSPRSSGEAGIEVIRILTAAEQSLRLGGARLPLGPAAGNARTDLGPDAEFQNMIRAIDRVDPSRPAVELVPEGSSPGANGHEDDAEVRHRVLVVGTDEQQLAFVTRALEAFRPGFEVATARTPEEASRWMEAFSPEVIIHDANIAAGAEP
ncbi:MAG: Gfo/Idh/MocA family oxidoreductase, partial [Acidimicrobiia bacterium]